MKERQTRKQLQAEPAKSIETEIKTFTRTSPLNRLPRTDNQPIFDEPLVCFADGNDPIFTEYKTIIDPNHLTPREALAEAHYTNPEDLPQCLSVISWILPIVKETRYSNRLQKLGPSRLWSYTLFYGEKFNRTLRQHVVDILTGMDYLSAAPTLQPYFKRLHNEKGPYSNWSERHVAYASGLGTFSLSDGFITERGIAHRCGNVVTDLVLPASPRTAESPYSNCLFYIDRSCNACIGRCPAGAITEEGHDKLKCEKYHHEDIVYLLEEYNLKEYNLDTPGCGLCQTKVPCEALNPTRKTKIWQGRKASSA